MYAIEFESAIEKGQVNLPSIYKNIFSCSKAKVIILIDKEPMQVNKQSTDFIDDLILNPRHFVGGEFLSRDEANAR
ncbi:MAG: hypothetical protein IPQ12_11090 [Polaromonas sp.]|nr:hypothetical protein [Polaromonas sp.]